MVLGRALLLRRTGTSSGSRARRRVLHGCLFHEHPPPWLLRRIPLRARYPLWRRLERKPWGRPQKIASVKSTELIVGYLLVRSVSCTGAAFCMTVGGSFGSAVWNGLSWKAKRGMTTGTDGGANVSCVTVDFCVDVPAEAPYTIMWDGRSWRDQPMLTSVPRTSPSSLAFNEVSCGSTAFCAGTVNKSLPWVWKGQVWQGSKLVGQGYAVDVSCSSKDFCAVADSGGTHRTWNGRSWSSAISVGNPSPDAEFQVSCSRHDTCMLVDEADAYLYTTDRA